MILTRFRAWMLLTIASLALLPHPLEAQAQHTTAMTADAVMARVRAQVKQYQATISSFICDESVDSTITVGEKIQEQMKVLDSLQVERTDKSGVFKETRVFTLVDGKKPRNQKVGMPYSYTGGFASLLDIVVSDPCSDFAFAADSPQDGKMPYELVSHLKATTATAPSCGNKVQTKQRPQTTISVDPQSFQITRLEFTAENVSFGAFAHLPFVPAPTPPNEMKTVVEYGSARVGEKTFNLPTSLISTVTGVKRGKPLVLAYRAQYSNYHRFASTATIVSQ